MLAGLDPALLDRVWFPLGEQTKDETRAEAARAGLAAARRPESQEACFLGGDDYRAFLERRGVKASRGAGRGHGRQGSRPSRRPLALHAGPAARPGCRRPRASLRAEDDRAARTPSSPARARSSPATACPRAACCTWPSSARRRSSATGLPRCRLASRRPQQASGSSSMSRRSASRLDRRPCSTRTTSSSGSGLIELGKRVTSGCDPRRVHRVGSRVARARGVPLPRRRRALLHALPPRRDARSDDEDDRAHGGRAAAR